MSAYETLPGPQGPIGPVGPQGAQGPQGTDSTPPGCVFFFAGGVAPTGYLLCNGAAVSRATYAALFAAIGTTFGVGDNSTTFNVPDLRSRVPVGAGQGSGLTNRALAANGGEENHALTAAENGAHTHTYTHPNTPTTEYYALSGIAGVKTTQPSTATSSSGSGTPHNVMQPFVVLTPIIKT